MPTKKVFISEINTVVPVGDNDFDVAVAFFIPSDDGTGSNQYTMHFIAPWGSDWRLQCRNAIKDWVGSSLQYEVDGVVFPDLSTI